jgi:bacterioferritin-associated ferredoxin
MGKTIICHCEDVSLGELLSAIEQGYKDIESIKRYTGIATGPCQGKCCLIQTLRALLSFPDVLSSEAGGPCGDGDIMNKGNDSKVRAAVKLPTIRQPVLPMRIKDISESGK